MPSVEGGCRSYECPPTARSNAKLMTTKLGPLEMPVLLQRVLHCSAVHTLSSGQLLFWDALPPGLHVSRRAWWVVGGERVRDVSELVNESRPSQTQPESFCGFCSAAICELPQMVRMQSVPRAIDQFFLPTPQVNASASNTGATRVDERRGNPMWESTLEYEDSIWGRSACRSRSERLHRHIGTTGCAIYHSNGRTFVSAW